MRQYVGYARFDSPEHVAALNAVYADMHVYYNLFQPVLRLAEKTPIPRPLPAGLDAPDGQRQGHAGRTTHPTTRLRRRWDTAQTPYQRLLVTGALSAAQRQRLQTLYDQTNPLALRQRIYDQLAALRAAVAERATSPAPQPQPSPAA